MEIKLWFLLAGSQIRKGIETRLGNNTFIKIPELMGWWSSRKAFQQLLWRHLKNHELAGVLISQNGNPPYFQPCTSKSGPPSLPLNSGLYSTISFPHFPQGAALGASDLNGSSHCKASWRWNRAACAGPLPRQCPQHCVKWPGVCLLTLWDLGR